VVLIGDGTDGVGEQLHPAARPLLNRIGLPRLPGQLDCVGIRAAWHSPELSQQNFLSHPFGNGWLLDRASFGETLRTAAADAGALPRTPAKLIGLSRENGGLHRWRLQLSDGEETCDWLVDATGRRGAVARLLGVKRRRINRQVALVGWLKTDHADDVDETLTVERTTSGWWYGCRLPGQRRVAGDVTASRPDARTWESRLRATRHLGRLVQAYRVEGALAVRAADSTILERCYGPQWVAIGDAAVSYDPLASRGLVSALGSGLAAAALVGAPESHLASWQARLQANFAAYSAERASLIPSSFG
jgi:flavin-dependent dehydrogenase